MKNIITLVFLITVLACNSVGQSDNTDVKVLSKTEFSDKLNSLEEFTLIDVRTENEFNNGSIEGALNCNILDGTFDKEIAKLDKTKPVLVFCAVGGRSGKARKKLESLGFKIVYDLKGGYNTWIK